MLIGINKGQHRKYQLADSATLLLIYTLTIVSAFAFQNAANKTLESFVPGYASSIWKRWIYVVILMIIVILLIAFLKSTRVGSGLEDPPKPMQKALKREKKRQQVENPWKSLGVPSWN